MIGDYPVTVCDSCLRASCWLGIFFCMNSHAAGTIEKTVHELHPLGRENPEYWFKNPSTGAIDQHALARYREEYGRDC